MWWRPDFETLLYPYLPPNVKRPKVVDLLKPPPSSFDAIENLFLMLVLSVGVHETLSCEIAG
jgi:cleavage and polyadenylation specificity factor subunit 5